MRQTRIRTAWGMLGILFVFAGTAPALGNEAAKPDYLQIVVSYADALIEQGRDTYGEVHSPLFATTLDRKTLRLFEGDDLERIVNIARVDWGIRPHDRMLTGANPMHDQNLYQLLYALSTVTGNNRYSEEADKTLKWFFQHCRSENTDFFAWGEHVGWDFYTETIIDKQGGKTHEYFRPWALWERSYQLAPDACGKFALGVWEHQIGDPETGNFSRHARWDIPGPGLDSEYPRHGGFYIDTWAHAYAQTKSPVYLKAIETLLDYFDNRRSPQSGAIPAESDERSKGKTIWPNSNLSLAVDLWNSAGRVPEDLAEKMRHSALKTDEVFLKIGHDLSPNGRGFVTTGHTDTLEPSGYSRLWATGYGEATDAAVADLCLLRYRQIEGEGYKRLILDTAVRYLNSEPFIEFPVYPGTLGDVILLMLGAHTITGERKYLDRADHFAQQAIELFLPDGSPLPKATSKHDHYEAITRADTMMMALLKLWITENDPTLNVCLIYNDR
ncbi:MAG: hypothetical protein ABIH23_20190 [bacterium]